MRLSAIGGHSGPGGEWGPGAGSGTTHNSLIRDSGCSGVSSM